MHTETMDFDIPGANPAPRLPKDGPVTHAHDTADSNRYRPNPTTNPTKRRPSLPNKERTTDRDQPRSDTFGHDSERAPLVAIERRVSYHTHTQSTHVNQAVQASIRLHSLRRRLSPATRPLISPRTRPSTTISCRSTSPSHRHRIRR